MNNIDLTERIRQRAFEIWQSEGQPHGRNLNHWLRAEGEVRDALRAQAPTEKPRTPPSGPPRKRAPTSKPAAKSPRQQPPKH